jgi:hypothetical protein
MESLSLPLSSRSTGRGVKPTRRVAGDNYPGTGRPAGSIGAPRAGDPNRCGGCGWRESRVLGVDSNRPRSGPLVGGPCRPRPTTKIPECAKNPRHPRLLGRLPSRRSCDGRPLFGDRDELKPRAAQQSGGMSRQIRRRRARACPTTILVHYAKLAAAPTRWRLELVEVDVDRWVLGSWRGPHCGTEGPRPESAVHRP